MSSQTALQEGAKLTPPAVVTALDLNHITLPDLVYILTAIYTLILIVLGLRKLFARTPNRKSGCPFADKD